MLVSALLAIIVLQLLERWFAMGRVANTVKSLSDKLAAVPPVIPPDRVEDDADVAALDAAAAQFSLDPVTGPPLRRSDSTSERKRAMGLCWYCHWGWPKAVRGVYGKAAASLTEIDENFDDGSIDWCLKACVGATGYSPDEVEIVRRSLEELRAIPQAERDPRPKDYDGLNPEKYPPPPHIAWSLW